MAIEFIGAGDMRRVAVLYQQTAPPVFDGARKAPKPGGYADSGADIAYCLRRRGVQLVTPVATPAPGSDRDWVFPDTDAGIAHAARLGATVLWANTVLFAGHPLDSRLGDFWLVGQLPERQQCADDKYATNAALRAAGLPVAASIIVADAAGGELPAIEALDDAYLREHGLSFPLVVKPVRGRGSQGVSLVADHAALLVALRELFDSAAFGKRAIVEAYLPGEELTLTVMACPRTDRSEAARAFVLPPVRRFNHVAGIAPYNGTVAVTRNSAVLSADAAKAPAIAALVEACAAAFERVGALAPIRVDCRADADGAFRLFDLNMKPNMTGAGRPGRDDQDSLSAIAAAAIGWHYADLLEAMLAAAWRRARV
ncbi:D-alanine--D-alanine ligase family protein [Chitinasiproducens palmae]|uniref:D-ala D-ala ligase C-terminus n=1 Tax=Chitinasiproducens palmae TaxID=1770053 RepID=A0A1H2PLI4_9BURK|nr:biotin carboxylase [Chitinasiproducens palmae]SDV47343.1 D-ala D-ala ligase C-terminus [Chitinasiproducens palmae]